MNVMTENFDLSNSIKYFDEKKSRSRTYVNHVKAVRIRSMRNTTLRLEPNGDYIFRLHKTDIVRHHSDGWMTITTGNWHTRTTLDRIRQTSGLFLFTEASSKALTDQQLRIMQIPYGVIPGRAGKAANYIRKSLPFFDGFRIQSHTGEIHPEDAAKIPSERRVKYQTPSKEARQEFKKIWTKAYGHIIMNITFGDWVEKLLDGKAFNWAIYAVPLSRAAELEDIDVEDSCELYNTFMQLICGRQLCTSHSSNEAVTLEKIREALIKAVPVARKKMLREFAESKNMLETKGGQILGNGYYVSQGDVK